MRIPKITKGTYKKHDIETVDIKKEDLKPCTYIPDVDIEDQKSVDKYVKVIKAFVRSSKPYTQLMSFLKYGYDMDTCYFLPNVKQTKGENISIEQHHLGGTITDIIEIVLRKRIKEGEEYDCNSIAKEVMLLHYQGKISIVPLSKTLHELIHADNSQLFVPVQFAGFGDTKLFFDEYKFYMQKEKKAQFEKYFLLSEAFDKKEDIIPDYLNVSIIYYNWLGIDIPRMDKLAELLENVA